MHIAMKSCDSFRLCALFAHAADYWVVQQAAVGGLLHGPEGAHKIVMQTVEGDAVSVHIQTHQSFALS